MDRGNVLDGRWGPRKDDNGGGGNDTGNGNPPGGNDLEKRLEAIEKVIPEIRERLARVETKVDSIEKNMATKADLDVLRHSISADVSKLITDQTWKYIGAAITLASIAFLAARFIKP